MNRLLSEVLELLHSSPDCTDLLGFLRDSQNICSLSDPVYDCVSPVLRELQEPPPLNNLNALVQSPELQRRVVSVVAKNLLGLTPSKAEPVCADDSCTDEQRGACLGARERQSSTRTTPIIVREAQPDRRVSLPMAPEALSASLPPHCPSVTPERLASAKMSPMSPTVVREAQLERRASLPEALEMLSTSLPPHSPSVTPERPASARTTPTIVREAEPDRRVSLPIVPEALSARLPLKPHSVMPAEPQEPSVTEEGEEEPPTAAEALQHFIATVREDNLGQEDTAAPQADGTQMPLSSSTDPALPRYLSYLRYLEALLNGEEDRRSSDPRDVILDVLSCLLWHLCPLQCVRDKEELRKRAELENQLLERVLKFVSLPDRTTTDLLREEPESRSLTDPVNDILSSVLLELQETPPVDNYMGTLDQSPELQRMVVSVVARNLPWGGPVARECVSAWGPGEAERQPPTADLPPQPGDAGQARGEVKLSLWKRFRRFCSQFSPRLSQLCVVRVTPM
ncbi:uncharacterized protein LOC136749806 [Amia ocellicauda]|uniref:uncharacterized protein LOC136749806 n=1 Tax=Amia ocellicauda TaxID=2972642 RepID=UPI0034640535